MSQQKYLFVFTEAPYQSARVREGLDAVLLGAAFDIHVSVLFTHNSVFSLISGQQASSHQLKPFTKAFAALPDFEVENVFIDQASALARGVCEVDILVPAEMLHYEEIRALVAQQDRVFTF